MTHKEEKIIDEPTPSETGLDLSLFGSRTQRRDPSGGDQRELDRPGSRRSGETAGVASEGKE
jgi:hypothetical protein